MRTREEHLEWCKERARAYLVDHDTRNAVTSMLSDMSKHPETLSAGEAMASFGIFVMMQSDLQMASKFIEGFN